MRRICVWAAAALFFTFLCSTAVHGQPSPTVTAMPAGESLPMDGTLAAPAWQHAGVIELSQQSPHPGEPTPFRTKVLLLRGGHTLYIGVIADDPDPARIATHTLVRDGNQGNDDSVTVVLDTFDTRRYAYVFQVNAAGAMADGLLSPTPAGNSNNGVNYNWDGIWQAAVHRNAHGWTAEIAIDTRSLQFGHGVSAWGFNVSRYVPRDLLTLAWSGINLNASVTGLQWEGTLTGVQGLQQGKGWDFQPYALVKSQTGSGTTSKAGFDLKYNFTPALAGLFTYHTDFAEAEADQQQINTGRFPLSFPEKRQFFLEGSNLFSFGYKLGNAGFIPYYSRSIGLVNGEPVPLDEGVKLLGQSNLGSLALLDTQMGGTSAANATNLFAGRGSLNLNQNLQIGTLITHGDPLGLSSNTFVGTDALWKTATLNGDKNLVLAAWGGHSSGSDLPAGSPNGYGFDIEYPNDLWYATAQYNVFGDALDPGIGFLQRPGTRQYYTQLEYMPRPAAGSFFDWAHQLFFDGQYSEVDGLTAADGGKQSSQWWLSPALITNGGYYLEFDVYQTYDTPSTAFPLAGVTVPVGQYTFNRARIAFNTPQSAPLVFQFVDSEGGDYAGTSHHAFIGANWNLPSGKLQLSVSQEWFFYYAPQGNGVTRLSTFGGTYSFTPNLYISTLAQYTNGIPGVGFNTRLRWIVDAASNIYLVWNHGLVTETNGLGEPVVSQGNEFIFKLQWDFRD